MAEQWVDITTIDNVTPFTKVRWKYSMSISRDAWFAEAPGLITDNMGWTQGNTAALGYFGGHRMNSYAYTCSMNCEQYGIDHTTIDYRVCVKDGLRSLYYDDTVVINGKTYYEVDFSLWENAAGKSLYMPYAVAPWSPGDIYVLVGAPIISIDKEGVSFKSTGGTKTITVTADDNWTATPSDSWITLSSDSGTSGTSTITVSVPDYQMTTKRSGSVVFSCSGESVTLTVKQAAVKTGGFGGIMLGALSASGLYLGDKEVSGLYVGDKIVFPTAQNVVINYGASEQITPNVAYSDSGWTTPLLSETYDSATSAGTVSFSGTGTTIPDNAYCGSTLTSVSLGKGVVSIGVSAFANCSSLLTISIPKTVTSIGNNAFAYGGLMRIKVPNSVTTLGTDLFSHDTLLESAVLPKDITSIPAGTFYGCSSLSAVTIPSGVTSIGSNAFRNTSSLTAITIPAGVTDVALNAFLSSGLEEITFESTTPPTVHNNSFNVTSATGVIKCPISAVATYTNWLTITLSGQSISGWTVSANAPSEAAFMFNYNAKQYDSTTRAFSKTYGQLFDEDLVLDEAPTSYNSDSVSFVGSTARMDKTYSWSSANPFNRDNSTNKTFTMVYKVGSFTSGSKNLFANRDATQYNYMARGSCLHTSNSSFLNMTPQSDPYILLVRIKADGSSERSVLDASGNVLQTVTDSSVSWGYSTSGVSFFSGQVGGGEYFDGIFYWMYLSNEALSDAEVQQVIDYNENL